MKEKYIYGFLLFKLFNLFLLDRFFDLFEKYGGYKSGKLKLKKPKQLQVRLILTFSLSYTVLELFILSCVYPSY